jgi:UDP-2,4-diacetamido-2,4,6-trideoxy-beta-L-altropyranose hydrolase
MLKIVIRADASIQIGVGHVMRCLTLAKELQENGTDISFICRDYPGNLQDFIQKQGFIVNLLPSPKTEYRRQENDPEHAPWLGVSWQQDVEETKEFLGDEIIDWLIVDHYGIDYRWHESLRVYTKCIMVIDDLADKKLSCDVLLDQTYGREKDAYVSVVPKQSQLLLGTDYALLRSEFSRLRLEAIEKRKNSCSIKRILVSMGSLDPNNLTAQILKGLANVEWQEKPVIDVVLGSRAPELKSIIEQSKKHILDINVLQDVDNMSELMLDADLAIGAGGTTSWERCCLGLPSLLVKLAENQKQVIAELVKAGAARNISSTDIENSITRECNDLQKNSIAMSELSINALRIVDGQGAQLIAIRMKPDLAQDGNHVTIRNACMSDADIIYKWQSDPNTRKYSHNAEVPQYEEHVNWLEKKLAEPASYFYIIEHDNKAAGVLRLDYQENTQNNIYIISIYISPDHYQQGLGAIALNYANLLFDKSELHAEILEDNVASKKLFVKTGYIKSSEQNLYIKYPEQNGLVH